MKKFLGKRFLLALGVVALSLGAATSSARAGFTIQDLIDGTYTGSGNLGGGITYAPTLTGHGIQVGDKQFSGFGDLSTGDMPAAANVNVVGFVDGAGNIGIEFQGAFHDNPGGVSSDALLTYTVKVTDPNSEITDAHINSNPNVLLGTGSIGVTESFDTPPSTPLPLNTLTVGALNFGSGTIIQPSDSTIFAVPVTELLVRKDILADGLTGVPQLSFLDQTFSQRTRHVPEPASFALVGLGLLGTGFAAYRRRKMAV